MRDRIAAGSDTADMRQRSCLHRLHAFAQRRGAAQLRFGRMPLVRGGRWVHASQRVCVAVLLLGALFVPMPVVADGFLDDAKVRDTLAGHTLKGKDWIEYYTAAGEIVGKVRYFGIRSYTGRWNVDGGRVCYVYGHPQADTCSWLRRQGERVTHHQRDGTLKKDGDAQRFEGNRLDLF